MSLHPSLRVDSAASQQRSVLSRIERIKDLMKKGLWTDDHPVVGLPKTKIMKVKSRKKVKEEKPEEGAVAAGAAPAETSAKAPAKAPAKTAAKGKE